MMDICLKVSTEKDLISALPFAYKKEWITDTHEYSLDIIGELYKNGALIPAFHANIRCNDNIAATIPVNIRVVPKKRRRVWL